jgi:hypothetical protein
MSDPPNDNETSHVNNLDHDEEVKPLYMYQYLQQLGDRQKELIENFYHSALEKPCGGNVRCEDTFGDMSYLGCAFLSPKPHHYAADIPHDPSDPCFNPNIVGPKSCEYCKASTTLQCDPKTCDRPPLYFLKKKPAFETSSTEWTADGYDARDVHGMDFLKRSSRIPQKSSTALENGGSDENKGGFIGFFQAKT